MKKQRILSALLTLCLVFSMVPTALAVDADDFTDVGRDSWCYEYVDYVTSKGYFLGTTSTTFSPNRNMTRAMFVVVLARFDKVEVDNSQSAFTDVEPGAWCAGAINWAAANKIVEGKGNGKFAPNDPITRAQMCAIMDRYLDYYTEKHNVTVAQEGTAKKLADQSQVPAYAAEAVKNCQEYGLIYGYEDGTFRPQANSTRAHVAAIIYRLAFLVGEAKPADGGTGGGGGGGGGGSSTTTYTLTLDANGGLVNGKATDSESVEAGKAYKLEKAVLTAAVKDGETQVFGGWAETSGNNEIYDADDSVVMNGNKTLTAVWIAPDDLILQAVTTSAMTVNKDYVGKVNTAAGEVQDLSLYATVGRIGVVAADDTTPRDVNLTAQAKLGANVVDKLLATAVYYANTIVFDIDDKNNDSVLTKTEVVDMVKAVAKELGIDISSDRAEAISDQVIDKAAGIGKGLWANFKNEDGYFFSSAEVKSGNTTLFTVSTGDKKGPTSVSLPDGKRAAVVTVAKEIGSQLYASLTKVTKETDTVELKAAVAVEFKDVVAPCTPYSTTYNCNVTLTLDSDGMLLYKFENGTNYLTLVIAGGAKKYDQTVDKLAKNAVGSAALRNRLDSTITNILKQDNIYSELNREMEKQYGFKLSVSEETVKTALLNAQGAWLTKNLSTGRGDGCYLPYEFFWLMGGTVEDGKLLIGGVETEKELCDNSSLITAFWNAVEGDLKEQFQKKLSQIGGLSNAEVNAATNAMLAVAKQVVTNEINAKIRSSIIKELSTGSLKDFCKYLNQLQDIKTYEAAKNVPLSKVASALRSDLLENNIGSRGDSYVSYLGKVINQIPESAAIKVNGVTIDKAALEALADASTTVEACEALADLIDDFGSMTVADFEEGVKAAVSYNTRSADFILTLDMQ